MAVYKYPPEVHEFVKKWCTQLRDEELAEACNKELGTHFTTTGMKAFRGNHGYRSNKRQWTSEEYWKYQKRWPQGMYEYIRDNSWGVSSKEMAERVNEKFGTHFSQSRMKCFRQQIGVKSGLTGWYQKSHPSGNKGKKIDEYMSPETAAKVRLTAFKKGHRPANELPIGTETVNSDGYRIIKVQMEGTQYERWAFLHRKTWEEHNGPIPDGYVLTFKDGNKLNCDIDNLMLATREELMLLYRKGYISEDPELTETALTVAKLQIKAKNIRKGKKKKGKEEHE